MAKSIFYSLAALVRKILFCNSKIKFKSERSDSFFLCRDFAIRTVSMETVICCVFFVLENWQIQTTKRKRLNTLIFGGLSNEGCPILSNRVHWKMVHHNNSINSFNLSNGEFLYSIGKAHLSIGLLHPISET